MFGIRHLTAEQKRLWSILGGMVVGGSVIKFVYFKHVSEIFKQNIKHNHEVGVKHLQEARSFAVWAQEDRESKMPELNEEQKEQLRRYLSLRARERPDIYPSS